MAEEKTVEERVAQAYVDGHRAGYVCGREDGISIGYSDAKLRAYLALDAGEGEAVAKPAVVAVRRSMTAMLGARQG